MSSRASGPTSIHDPNMPDAATRSALGFGPGKQQCDGAGVERVVLPGGPGQGPAVDGEVGGQLDDVLQPGGVAEGQVHGPAEGSGSRCDLPGSGRVRGPMTGQAPRASTHPPARAHIDGPAPGRR